MFRSALLILSGNAAASLMLLARNLIIARLIPVSDYGIAATFALAMAMVEMMSQLGLQQQIIQSKNGEDPHLQAALQGFQVLRGVIAGLVMFVLARPFSDFLNVPEAAWAYQLLALVPILNAFTHFDVHRLNRTMVFLPAILTGVLPALLSLAAVWPLTKLYAGYQVMLYAILLQAVMTLTTSHWVARRPYRITLDRLVIVNSLRFGWPLLLNGVLMFLVFNSDKLIVGRELGMAALAIFAMGLTLTLTPTLVLAKSAQNFFLPQLSAVDRGSNEGRVRFHYLSRVTMQTSLLSGAGLVTIILLFGERFVQLVLGARYTDLIPLLVPLAIVQALRVAKAGCAVVALSTGHTSNALQANLLRVAVIPFAWYAVASGAGISTVVIIAALGEASGLVLSLFLIRRSPGVPIRKMLPSITSFATFVSAISIYSFYNIGLISEYALIAASLLGVIIVSMKDLRSYLGNKIR